MSVSVQLQSTKTSPLESNNNMMKKKSSNNEQRSNIFIIIQHQIHDIDDNTIAKQYYQLSSCDDQQTIGQLIKEQSDINIQNVPLFFQFTSQVNKSLNKGYQKNTPVSILYEYQQSNNKIPNKKQLPMHSDQCKIFIRIYLLNQNISKQQFLDMPNYYPCSENISLTRKQLIQIKNQLKNNQSKIKSTIKKTNEKPIPLHKKYQNYQMTANLKPSQSNKYEQMEFTIKPILDIPCKVILEFMFTIDKLKQCSGFLRNSNYTTNKIGYGHENIKQRSKTQSNKIQSTKIISKYNLDYHDKDTQYPKQKSKSRSNIHQQQFSDKNMLSCDNCCEELDIPELKSNSDVNSEAFSKIKTTRRRYTSKNVTFYEGACKNQNIFSCLDKKIGGQQFSFIQPYQGHKNQ